MAKDRSAPKLLRIGEVSRLTGVHPHTLRYWESEFQILAPNRNLSKQRLYRQADLELIGTIKYLLDQGKYTLAGVKQYLAEQAQRPAAAGPSPPSPPLPDEEAVLQQVQEELRAIRELLG